MANIQHSDIVFTSNGTPEGDVAVFNFRCKFDTSKIMYNNVLNTPSMDANIVTGLVDVENVMLWEGNGLFTFGKLGRMTRNDIHNVPLGQSYYHCYEDYIEAEKRGVVTNISNISYLNGCTQFLIHCEDAHAPNLCFWYTLVKKFYGELINITYKTYGEFSDMICATNMTQEPIYHIHIYSQNIFNIPAVAVETAEYNGYKNYYINTNNSYLHKGFNNNYYFDMLFEGTAEECKKELEVNFFNSKINMPLDEVLRLLQNNTDDVHVSINEYNFIPIDKISEIFG